MPIKILFFISMKHENTAGRHFGLLILHSELIWSKICSSHPVRDLMLSPSGVIKSRREEGLGMAHEHSHSLVMK